MKRSLPSVSEMIYLQAARMGQALASPQRLRALNLLAQSPRTVGDLAVELGESKASTSAHLKVLRSACLVKDERRGRQVWCRLASETVAGLLVTIREAAETLMPELREVIRDAIEDPHALESMNFEQLWREVTAGRVVLIDLRPREEYAAGHLPGAQSLPFEELDEADVECLAEGPPKIVAYCRGPWCLKARQGVARLRELGVDAQRLNAGVAEWRAKGMSLES